MSHQPKRGSRGAQAAMRMREGERECRLCGCTDRQPCHTEKGVCHWVEADLCSDCRGYSLANIGK